MLYLRATSPASVVVGPFIYNGDAISSYTTMEVSSATIIDIYKITTKSDITTTAAGANAMAHIANGYYSLVLTSGNTDTVGPFMITGDHASALHVWHRYQIIPAAIYDSLMVATVTLDSTFASGAQASSLSALAQASTVAGVAQASATTAILTHYAQASKLTAVQTDVTSVLTNYAQASKLTAVQVDITSVLTNYAQASKLTAVQTDITSVLTNYAQASAIVTLDAVVDTVKVDTASSLVKINAIASSVWDEALAAHVTSGTTGEALNAAGGAGDPWITALPGSYTGTQAGMILASMGYASSLSNVQTDVTSVLTNYAQASKLTAVQTDITSVLTNYAQASKLTAVQTDITSVLTNYAQASAVAAVKVDTASSLVWIASAHTNIANVASSTWDIVRASHTTVGSFGEVSTVASTVTAVWAASEVENLAQASYLTAVQTDVTSVLTNYAQASKLTAVQTDVTSVLTNYAQASKLTAVQTDITSVLTNYAQASAVAAVQVDMTSSLVWLASVHTNVGTVDGIVDTLVANYAQASALAAVKVETASSLAKIDLVQGLWYKGTVTDVPDTNKFTVATMAGLGAGIFADTTNPYNVFVLRDAGGTGAAPQGEMKKVTAYSTTLGIFTTSAFTAAVNTGDEVLIINPRVAELLSTPYAVWDELIASHSTTGSMAEKLTLIGTDITSALTNIALLPSDADINTQVLDVVNTDTYGEPSQGAPSATATLAAKINYIYKFMRNKIETTTTSITVYNDAGSTADHRADISDDGTTFSRGEFGTGA